MSESMKEAFPYADPGIKPLGSRVLVQIRTPMKKTAGGILLTTSDQDNEKWNTQIGKVIDIGPLAFRNRDTQKLWPEGQWCEPGQFVRVPKYGGDRWEVKIGDSEETALFVLFNDLDMIGLVTTDPTHVKAFF